MCFIFFVAENFFASCFYAQIMQNYIDKKKQRTKAFRQYPLDFFGLACLTRCF